MNVVFVFVLLCVFRFVMFVFVQLGLCRARGTTEGGEVILACVRYTRVLLYLRM